MQYMYCPVRLCSVHVLSGKNMLYEYSTCSVQQELTSIHLLFSMKVTLFGNIAGSLVDG